MDHSGSNSHINRLKTTLGRKGIEVNYFVVTSCISGGRFTTSHYTDVIMTTMPSEITTSRLFTQSFIRAQIKGNIKAPRHWPLCREFTGTGEFSAQRASNAENVSIWWRHHEVQPVTTKYVINCCTRVHASSLKSIFQFICVVSCALQLINYAHSGPDYMWHFGHTWSHFSD